MSISTAYRTIPILQEGKSYATTKKDFSYTPGMDPVRKLIADKAEEHGGLSALSKRVGKNHAYFQQFIRRGIPVYLPEIVRGRLSKLIGVPEDALRGQDVPAKEPVPLAPRNAKISAPVELGRGSTVPLMGQGKAGPNGRFVFNGQRIADILAPPSLARVQGAYAVYVIGDCMSPRYEAGEVVFVDPNRPVVKGHYVVAQIAGDEGDAPDGYIKQFVAFDDKRLKLQQLNPRKILTFPKGIVVSVHRIIMGGDG